MPNGFHNVPNSSIITDLNGTNTNTPNHSLDTENRVLREALGYAINNNQQPQQTVSDDDKVITKNKIIGFFVLVITGLFGFGTYIHSIDKEVTVLSKMVSDLEENVKDNSNLKMDIVRMKEHIKTLKEKTSILEKNSHPPTK